MILLPTSTDTWLAEWALRNNGSYRCYFSPACIPVSLRAVGLAGTKRGTPQIVGAGGIPVTTIELYKHVVSIEKPKDFK